MFGVVAWAASPIIVTRRSPQLSTGGRSKMSWRRISSSGVASITSSTQSGAPANVSRTSFFRPAGESPSPSSILADENQ